MCSAREQAFPVQNGLPHSCQPSSLCQTTCILAFFGPEPQTILYLSVIQSQSLETHSLSYLWPGSTCQHISHICYFSSCFNQIFNKKQLIGNILYILYFSAWFEGILSLMGWKIPQQWELVQLTHLTTVLTRK